MLLKIHMKPVGKGRPKFTRVGGFVKAYTPAKSRDAEEMIRSEWYRQDREQISGMVEVVITAIFQPPKSTSKKREAELIGKPYPHKPDADNIAKLVLDALNGCAWEDDATVVRLTSRKVYGSEDMIVVEADEVF
jgi:Holliday junction resolvase RusA-like endonuclease